MTAATVIVAARRTPIGSLNGALSPLAGHELGAIAIRAALADAGIGADLVEETILGQVLTGGQGMNPARQAARRAGLPDSAPAALVNQVCGSGLRAVVLAHQQVATGSAGIVVAGGQESMSNAPHVAPLRQGRKLGDITLRDTVASDGLNDAFYGYPMGVTAENVARAHQIGRAAQDAFALASQHKASAASRAGRFAAEIAPVTIEARKGPVTVDADEHIRHDATLEAMARLKPAFLDGGTVTAANASGINDGAAALVLMAGDEAERRNLKPLGRIAAWAHAGVDPQLMGLGPIPASRKALERAGWSAADVELWEINEAFAAQSLAVVSELGLDPDRVNVNGGAIALGHPIGASGARILVTLLHEMARRDARRGVATLCIGGGMGIALAVQRD
ncbi:MAG: acetyl-CoA C-acetyltransferase [Devosia sp.]|uniref:acetyl-CoA C-acetyltransferase n=1 Tax=Devosia sp. TaxID=1871048 RepID=UPI001AD3D409|nr:acetyl-CoA C-acetyltransferase [Devosia sp.]MBN9309281.1 acetyl-CoA C-acetyltransferase [Devosia sp.]MBN9314955.1 acetyl-CoA C-acetyltransferase [Devosia sp.]